MAVVVLLAGCETLPMGKGVRPMATQDCTGQATCTIVVDPASGTVPDRVRVSHQHANVIHWRLPPSGPWKWGPGGVEFKPPGNTHFHCSAGGSGPVRTCTKPASAPKGEYEYVLHLVYDPFMVNE